MVLTVRCPGCQYRLWNLTSRECPECGCPFKPSAFRFAPGSVQFCCPHCRQAYYGSAENGHLQPQEFDCVQCGRHLHMDEMVLLPAEGLDEELTEDALPWLERANRGFWKSWYRTTIRAMLDPGRLMAALPRDASLASAWWYALVSNALFCLVGGAWFFILPILLTTVGRRGSGVGAAFGLLAGCLGCALLLLVIMSIWGLLAHGLLMLTGRVTRPLGATYHALCYGSGANAPSAIPFFGFYVGWIWWVISATLMLKRAQGVHGARAAVAVGTPPVLALAAFVSLSVWLLTTAMAAARQRGISLAANELRPVAEALKRYARAHHSHGPQHALELLLNGGLDPFDLLSAFTATQAESVPLGATTLAQFSELTGDEQQAVVRTCIEALPTNVVAHRVGDFIFTHHGIDFAGADRSLWIALFWPDPAAMPRFRPDLRVAVAAADGTVREFEASRMQAEIEDQNALRARNGLAPLIHPHKITHARPQVGSSPASAGDGESP